MLDSDGVEPEYVITPETAICPPWNALWQRYTNWGLGNMAAFSRNWPSDATQRVTRVNAARTVEVKTCPLTPLTIEDADAVFIEVDHFHRHDWPEKLLKIVNVAPECLAEHAGTTDPRIVALNLFGENMAKALSDLNDVCAEHKIKRLASIPIGLADEGTELDQWAAQGGPGPEKLTIFADLPGDYTGLSSRCARDKKVKKAGE